MTLTVVETRELTGADFQSLEGVRGEGAPTIDRLRERHHALARALASGLTPAQASASTGYCSSRISILQSDPAFQELVAFYRADVNAAYSAMHERMATLGLTTVEELQTRLETAPESFDAKDLRELLKTVADRTGHAPVARNVNVNLNVGMGDRLEAARKRAMEASRIIDVTPNE